MIDKCENVPIADMIPLIQTAVANGKSVEMTVTGRSMLPLLLDRISSVRLVRPEMLKAGDIVLFRNSSGHYLLHRIRMIRDGRYDIQGDNQSVPDRDVPRESILAVVTAYSRDGRHWKTGDRLYRGLLPLIRTARRLKTRVRKRAALWLNR